MYLLVDNYDSFTYNLYALLVLNGCKVDVIKNREYKNADDYEGIILSPGPSNPKNSGTTLQYLQEYAGKKPIFGVCLGMQSIGYHLGYDVVHASTVMHGKKDKMKITKDSILFSGIDGEFDAVRYHSLAVKADDSIVTSRAETDSEVMSIEIPEKKLFGVQFHPESIMSTCGDIIVKNFIKFCNGGNV